MTSEAFRNDSMFLRNQFETDGTFEMPVIKKQKVNLEQFSLIGYDQTVPMEKENTDSFVHFFLDDYKFEAIWKEPEPRLQKLGQYKGVLSPQFSTYYTMPQPLQIYNTFRSRWCGAYLQSNGLTVIPTVSWGLPQSYWYCFDGIEKGSVVAVSTLGVKKEKDFFLQGYREMLRRIEPEAIICYAAPFDEMEGNVIHVDYAETNHLRPREKIWSGYILPACAPMPQTAGTPSLSGEYITKRCGYIVTAGMGGGGRNYPRFPGWDPTKSLGKGYEWRGRGNSLSGKGNWFNPNTKEMLHPDLNHLEPYGPHWDYNYPGGGDGFRIFPDGTMKPKYYEGEIVYA